MVENTLAKLSEMLNSRGWGGKGDETHYRNVTSARNHVTSPRRGSDRGVERGKCQRLSEAN